MGAQTGRLPLGVSAPAVTAELMSSSEYTGPFPPIFRETRPVSTWSIRSAVQKRRSGLFRVRRPVDSSQRDGGMRRVVSYRAGRRPAAGGAWAQPATPVEKRTPEIVVTGESVDRSISRPHRAWW